MTTDQPYPGDVLEHALNKGILSAANRYNLEKEEVRSVVKQFAHELEDWGPCSCEKSKWPMMCFMCDKGTQNRINI